MSHERRVFVDIVHDGGGEVELSGSDSHHLRSVLRITEGYPIIVVDRANGVAHDAIVTATPTDHNIRVKLLRIHTSQTRDSSAVRSVVFSLGKNPVNDLVCEKLGELGVQNLIFWQAARSVIKVHTGEREKKVERWSRIAESAAKQSQKSFVMRVHLALTEHEMHKTLESLTESGDVCICCSLAPESIPLRKISRPSGKTHLLIGPAGDLTADEEKSLVCRGFKQASLGSFLLRAETAAIASVAMVEALWGGER